MTNEDEPRRPAVLYIGGTGRSGSTLLARMLGQTPGYAAIGELRYVLDRGAGQNHLCGCGEPFRNCPFWRKVFDRVLGGFDDGAVAHLLSLHESVDRVRHIPMLARPTLRTARFGRALAEYSRFVADLYLAVADVADADVVVDSSKDPSYAYLLDATDGVDASFVHLLRDSRAVAFSWLRPKVRPEIHWKLEHMRKRKPSRSGLLWAEYHLLFDALGRRARRFRTLQYEEFVRRPEEVLDELRAWMPAPVEARTPHWEFVHDISGNPLRFATAPLVVREDDEWKVRMGRRDRAVVTALTAPLLRRYGYLGRPR